MVRTVEGPARGKERSLLPDDGMAGLILLVADVESALNDRTALNGSQFRTLALLCREDEVLSASDIAEVLMLPRSTVSTCLTQLERRHLAKRSYSGRSVGITPTSAGMNAAVEGAMACDESLARIWGLLDERSRRTSQMLNAASGLRSGHAAFKNGQLNLSMMAFGNLSKSKTIFKVSAQSERLSLNEARVLNCIAGHPRSMGDVFAAILLNPSRVTGAVSSLESKGLAKRTTSHVDRRISKVRATEEGVRAAESVAGEYGRGIAELLGQVTADERRFYERISAVFAKHFRSLGKR